MARPKKVIVTAAVTGGIHTPSMTPYLPCGVDAIADAAVEAANAGASVVHVHAREDNGKPTSNLEVMGEILRKIKARSDVIIGVTTGGAIGMSVEERLAAIPLYRPEMASFNGGTMNFNLAELVNSFDTPKYDWEIPFLKNTATVVFRNTFEEMEKIVGIMNQAGTVPEYEIFDFGQINNILYLYKKGLLRKPLYFQFVPGVLGGIPLNPQNIMYFVNQLKTDFGDDALFSMVAAGRRIYRYETMSAILGGNVRVGLEDSIYYNPSGELATGNAQQVGKIISILKKLDFEIAAPDEAREILHTKGKDNVNF
ncbi:MAG TPA: 3-keto-5-aminohexanoate cleavage protein [Anaerovoracaceae bacterium]|nr:3-keto-5-aminohexanoate cleavage protein [Anaerovoracaceae bacterium]